MSPMLSPVLLAAILCGFPRTLGSSHVDALTRVPVGLLKANGEELQDQVMAQHGYVITAHSLKLFGYCPECQKLGAAGD